MKKILISSAFVVTVLVAVFGFTSSVANAGGFFNVAGGCPTYDVYYPNRFSSTYCYPSYVPNPGYSSYPYNTTYGSYGYSYGYGYGYNYSYSNYPTQPYQYNQAFYPYNRSAGYYYPSYSYGWYR